MAESPRIRFLVDRPRVEKGAWLAFIAVMLGLFVISIPARYEQLTDTVRTLLPSLPPDGGPFLTWFVADGAYARVVLALEILFVAAFSFTSTGIAWGKTNDRRAMFFSAVFIGYPVWVTPTLDALDAGGGLGGAIGVIQAAGLQLAIMFFLLFPDARFVPRWTRFSAAGWAIYNLVWGLWPDAWFSLVDPFHVPVAIFAVLMTGWTTGLVAQAIRFRALTQTERHQTKLVLAAVAAAVAGYGAVYLTGTVVPDQGTARLAYDLYAVPIFWVLAIPIAFALAVSMFRHQLFDFNLIVKRTLVYGPLTAILGLTYLGSVAVLQLLFHPVVGKSDWAVAGSTLAAAALFRPARARIQGFIDRKFFRARYDATQAVGHLTSTLRDDVDLGTISHRLVEVVRETLQPSSVTLWLRPTHSPARNGDEVLGALRETASSSPGPT